MSIWLTGVKIVLYSLVFVRVFQRTAVSFPLVSIALILLISGFLRSFYNYKKSKLNIITLLMDLFFTIIFSLFADRSIDKLFMIYVIEGTAILPEPFSFTFAALSTAISLGSAMLNGLREDGLLKPPELVESMQYVFIFILVFSERRQREQKQAKEKLAKELSYANLQLQESMAMSESLASSAERNRIAGEIHDSLGHDLTGLILTLEAGKKLDTHNPEEGKAYWDKAIQISRTALNSVRKLVSEKREESFEFELIPHLKEMVRNVQTLTGLKIELDIQSGNTRLLGKEQFNVYRIFQEAVTNTLRHANADLVRISISSSTEMFKFCYWDNGSGTDRIVAGNGLKGMKERINDINGSISFQSQAGNGFRIEGSIEKNESRGIGQ